MINIRSVVQIIEQIYFLMINKFMKELEIDWIRKTNSSSTYVGRGYSKEKIEMESFDFYNCF